MFGAFSVICKRLQGRCRRYRSPYRGITTGDSRERADQRSWNPPAKANFRIEIRKVGTHRNLSTPAMAFGSDLINQKSLINRSRVKGSLLRLCFLCFQCKLKTYPHILSLSDCPIFGDVARKIVLQKTVAVF